MKYLILVHRLGGLSLPRNNVVRLTDHPDMTVNYYHGRKATKQREQQYGGSCIDAPLLMALPRDVWAHALSCNIVDVPRFGTLRALAAYGGIQYGGCEIFHHSLVISSF